MRHLSEPMGAGGPALTFAASHHQSAISMCTHPNDDLQPLQPQIPGRIWQAFAVPFSGSTNYRVGSILRRI